MRFYTLIISLSNLCNCIPKWDENNWIIKKKSKHEVNNSHDIVMYSYICHYHRDHVTWTFHSFVISLLCNNIPTWSRLKGNSVTPNIWPNHLSKPYSLSLKMRLYCLGIKCQIDVLSLPHKSGVVDPLFLTAGKVRSIYSLNQDLFYLILWDYLCHSAVWCLRFFGELHEYNLCKLWYWRSE